MSCLAGLVECLVRVESYTGKGRYGSGVLLAADLVLTCAHVVDEAHHAAAGEAARSGGTLHEANAMLRNKALDQAVARVTLFDGKARTGFLQAVDTDFDMVLLRLDGESSLPVVPPPLDDMAAKSGGDGAGIGFERRAEGGYAIRTAAVSPSARESDALMSETRVFSGDASAGMSGGPVFRKAAGGYVLTGIYELGSAAAAHSRLIKHPKIRQFLARHGVDLPNRTGLAASEFGLASSFECRPFQGEPGWSWIRATRCDQRLHPGEMATRYVASRPLTAHDADLLVGRRHPEILRTVRGRFFAEFTATEAVEAVHLLARQAGLDVSLARMACLDAVTADAQDVVGAAPRTLLPMPVSDALAGRRDFRCLPGGVNEWVCDDRTASSGGEASLPKRAARDRQTGAWKTEAPRLLSRSAAIRALLRPGVSVSVWADCR